MSRAAEFRLASALACYPTEESAGRVVRAAVESGALCGAVHAEGTLGAASRALAAAGAIPLASLEEEYIERFDRGVADTPLHGTGYARAGARCGLSDVVGYYRAFGVESRSRERQDHVSVELEFYGWLVRKAAHLERIGDFEGAGIVFDARRRFLAEHLGPLATAIARRPGVRGSAAYAPVFEWIAALIAEEAAKLGVAIEPLELGAARGEAGERADAASELDELLVLAEA